MIDDEIMDVLAQASGGKKLAPPDVVVDIRPLARMDRDQSL